MRGDPGWDDEGDRAANWQESMASTSRRYTAAILHITDVKINASGHCTRTYAAVGAARSRANYCDAVRPGRVESSIPCFGDFLEG
jgi:hypothetical protein